MNFFVLDVPLFPNEVFFLRNTCSKVCSRVSCWRGTGVVLCSVHENALYPPLINWKQMSDRDPDGEQGNFNVFWTDTSVLINRFATVAESTFWFPKFFFQTRMFPFISPNGETKQISYFFGFNYDFRLCLNSFTTQFKLETSDTQSLTRFAKVKIFQNNQTRLNLCPTIRENLLMELPPGLCLLYPHRVYFNTARSILQLFIGLTTIPNCKNF